MEPFYRDRADTKEVEKLRAQSEHHGGGGSRETNLGKEKKVTDITLQRNQNP